MKIFNTKIKGLKIIVLKKHKDERGSLFENFDNRKIKWDNLIFDYVSTSKKNVLRGFHFQSQFQQAKYVTVIKGKILDIVIDLRKNSRSFGKTFSIILSDKNCKSLYIPKGFAHAFYSYEKVNTIYYKLSDYYKPAYEDGIIWNDKSLKISWPSKKPIVSKKDLTMLTLKEFKTKYKSL